LSYGKEDSHLANIGGYGASTSQMMGNAARRQSGPRRGAPAWANNFQPTEGSLSLIRLIPGDFVAERVNSDTGEVYTERVPWFEYREHFHATNKQSIICSGGIHWMDEKKAKPCRGCDIWREDQKERWRIEREKGVKPTGPKRISAVNKYAFYTLDTGWFFKGSRLDEHGRPILSKSNNQPYVDWIKYIDAMQPEYIVAYNEVARVGKQLEWVQGRLLTWPTGYGQFTALSGYVELIQKHCASCGGQNCLQNTGWMCPRCSCPTFQAHEQTLPTDEVKRLTSKEVLCRNCQLFAYPKAVLHCQYCQNPKQAGLYDVDLQVHQVRVNKNPQLQITWSSGPKPVDPLFSEQLKNLPDMQKKFSATKYEEQVSKFGAAPPPAHVQNQAPQWGQQPPNAPQGYATYPGHPGYAQPPAPQGYNPGYPPAPQGYQPQGYPQQQPQQAPVYPQYSVYPPPDYPQR
jgi:hypothetical protein